MPIVDPPAGWITGIGRSRGSRGAIATLAAAGAVALFFRVQLSTRFGWIFGEEYDGTIEVVLLEHWYAVLRGLAAWGAPNYHYPYPHVLAYNDGYFLSGLIYAPFRAIGCDPFVSVTLVHMAWKAIGFAAMYRLLRGVLAVPFPAALLGGVLFVLADNTLMQAVHGQLMMLNLVPVLAIQLVRFIRSVRDGRAGPAFAWGTAFSGLYGAVALTGFYMAWFFGYFALVTTIILFCVNGAEGRRRLGAGAIAARWGIIGAVLIALAALTPLAMLYLPQMGQGSEHSYGEALEGMVSPFEIINVGQGNLLWGRVSAGLIRRLAHDEPSTGEAIAGFPLLLLALAGIAIAWQIRERGCPPLLAVAIAVPLCWIPTVALDGHSAWRIVYALVPGASALRELERFQLFLTVPVIVLAITLIARWRGSGLRLLAPLLAAALIVEEINLAPPTGIERAAQLHRVNAIPPIPSDCAAFLLIYAAPPQPHQPWEWSYVDAAEDRETAPHIDAMLLAALRRVPTINGYATFGPPDGLNGDASSPRFADQARAYAAAHGLHRVCSYDSRRPRKWAMLVP